MDQDLVDLSLFDDFPAASRHNTIQQRPAFQRLINEASQAGDYQGLHLGYPRSCTMKPLPPLPRKIVCAIRLDPRPGHGGSRCILSRIQRARLGEHAPRSTPSANTLQQRRNTHPVPQLILSAPQPPPAPMAQPEEPSRPACPMIWLPDAQMWMMIDDNDFVTYIPPEYTLLRLINANTHAPNPHQIYDRNQNIHLSERNSGRSSNVGTRTRDYLRCSRKLSIVSRCTNTITRMSHQPSRWSVIGSHSTRRRERAGILLLAVSVLLAQIFQPIHGCWIVSGGLWRLSGLSQHVDKEFITTKAARSLYCVIRTPRVSCSRPLYSA